MTRRKQGEAKRKSRNNTGEKLMKALSSVTKGKGRGKTHGVDGVR